MAEAIGDGLKPEVLPTRFDNADKAAKKANHQLLTIADAV
jgi:hypothetical protein